MSNPVSFPVVDEHTHAALEAEGPSDIEPLHLQWYQQNQVGFAPGMSSSDHVLAMGLLLKPSVFEQLRTKLRDFCTEAQLLNKKYVTISAKTRRD